MARAALGLGFRELAALAKVSTSTITRFERGEFLRERTIDALRAALERAGVEFTNGDQPGVRMKAARIMRATKAGRVAAKAKPKKR
jgi:transcriptional regulator with XRE-family HTH domain